VLNHYLSGEITELYGYLPSLVELQRGFQQMENLASPRKIRRSVLIAGAAVLTVACLTGFYLFLSKGTLIVEAQIVYKLYGPQPVARQSLYLLDHDIQLPRKDDPKFQAKVDSLKNEQEKTNLLLTAVALHGFFQLRGKNISDDQAKSLLNIIANTRAAWDMHLVKETQTDFKGLAKFKGVRPGQYWVMGETETRGGLAAWIVPATIKRGTNKLILDQNNALVIN
jgi:hypothetical protein